MGCGCSVLGGPKAAAVAPLPHTEWAQLEAGSTWSRLGGGEIEPLLAYTDVIDAAWLLRFAKGEVMKERKGVVPAWQQVPPEAKLSLKQLRRTTMIFNLPVAVLSYGWAASHHPDPTGALLRRLIPVLEAMAHSCEHGTSPEFTSSRLASWGIVWDFMSLPQRGYTSGYDEATDDRTSDERARFGRGLRSINVWYAHPHTYTLVCDWPMPDSAENAAPIERRGWCIFERRLSCVRKSVLGCLFLSALDDEKRLEAAAAVFVEALGDKKQREAAAPTAARDPRRSTAGGLWGTWHHVLATCSISRPPPQLPDDFEAMLREGIAREAAEAGTGFRFTNGKDATDVCIPQYREAFSVYMPRGGALFFGRCRWGDEDLKQLAAALAFVRRAGETCQAKTLDLAFSGLSPAAEPVLLELVGAGTLRLLRRIDVGHNPQLGQATALKALCEERGIEWDVGVRVLTARGARTQEALAVR